MLETCKFMQIAHFGDMDDLIFDDDDVFCLFVLFCLWLVCKLYGIPLVLDTIN